MKTIFKLSILAVIALTAVFTLTNQVTASEGITVTQNNQTGIQPEMSSPNYEMDLDLR